MKRRRVDTENWSRGSIVAKRRKESKDNGDRRLLASWIDPKNGQFAWKPNVVVARNLKLIRELGEGTYGRVFECQPLRRKRLRMIEMDDDIPEDDPRGEELDGGYMDDKTYAIKFVGGGEDARHAKNARIEAQILKRLRMMDPKGEFGCVKLIEDFAFYSFHCIVTEKLGMSSYDYLASNNFQPFVLSDIRIIARRLVKCLYFLRTLKLVHTDLKLENVLFVSSSSSAEEEEEEEWIKKPDYLLRRNKKRWCKDDQFQKHPKNVDVRVIDFGAAKFLKDGEKGYHLINTRQYRAPEVILDIGWGVESDMWSFGCILMELFTGRLLFPNHQHMEHLAMIDHLFGPFPDHILRAARKRRGWKYVYDCRLADGGLKQRPPECSSTLHSRSGSQRSCERDDDDDDDFQNENEKRNSSSDDDDESENGNGDIDNGIDYGFGNDEEFLDRYKKHMESKYQKQEFRISWPEGAANNLRSLKFVSKLKLFDPQNAASSLSQELIEFRDFIRTILVIDPDKRCTPMEAEKHPFLRNRKSASEISNLNQREDEEASSSLSSSEVIVCSSEKNVIESPT